MALNSTLTIQWALQIGWSISKVQTMVNQQLAFEGQCPKCGLVGI
jgi:hypothetical protein